MDKIIFNKIQKILLEDWDPIGIKDELYAQDEYDDYIPKVLEFAKHKDHKGLINYLKYVERELMRLPPINRDFNGIIKKIETILFTS